VTEPEHGARGPVEALLVDEDGKMLAIVRFDSVEERDRVLQTGTKLSVSPAPATSPAQYRAVFCGRQRHGSQEPVPVFERMVLPPLVVTIDA
jgi:hypothetical protein